jgi:hypothetical protein
MRAKIGRLLTVEGIAPTVWRTLGVP